MTTIHLTDAQRDTFAACGLIVIDGEPFGGCTCFTETGVHTDTCLFHKLVAPEGRGARVVTLTATCPTCRGSGRINQQHLGWCDRPCTECEQATEPYQWPSGVVRLGRFTIPALLPVIAADVTSKGDYAQVYPATTKCPNLHPYGRRCPECATHEYAGAMWVTGQGYLSLDPLPHPGQFIARPERVA